MNYLATFVILILASTNASKYFRPEHQYQQEPATRERFPGMPYLAIALEEDPYIQGDESSKWESPLDPRIFVSDLESLGNFIQDEEPRIVILWKVEGAEWHQWPSLYVCFGVALSSLMILGHLPRNADKDDPNDFRMKRTKTSLSIDNPLDVLRQQYFRSLARRMKFKSIEKNREHLLKTGKRSEKDVHFPINLTKQTNFPSKSTSKEFVENGLQSGSRSNEPNPSSRRYQDRLDDFSSSYQT